MPYPNYRFFSLCFILPVLFVFSACNPNPSKTKTVQKDSIARKDVSIHGYFSNQQVLHTDTASLKSFFIKHPLLKEYENEVSQFYIYRNFLFAWYNVNGLAEQASNLYIHLDNLEQEGIQVKIPYKENLDSLLNDPLTEQHAEMATEILLTAEYFFYADKVWNGISEKVTTKLEWLLPRKKLNLPYLTDSLLNEPSASLFTENYNVLQYNLLKMQLKKYKQLDSIGIWETLIPEKKSYIKNDSSDFIRTLRHRLFLLGDLADDSVSKWFDDKLEAAVKSFQDRNGMLPDGVAGPELLQEINIPLKANIRKLIVNMERTRWIPKNLQKHYLIINIPFFTLAAYDNDTVTFKMNVVVGKALHKTVIFNGDIKYIVFSPYWNVTPSIMKNEILPAIRKNPNYLKKNNMEWNGNSIRQKPGPSNSLGLVKFLFPNSFNIYLHDSPAKSLFSAQSRAFSHGCIRLAEPKKLAEYLLKDDKAWNGEKINQAMHSGKEKYVTLSHPVPVYIGYMTAWVDKLGKLNFRKDIYNRDNPLEEMLIQ